MDVAAAATLPQQGDYDIQALLSRIHQVEPLNGVASVPATTATHSPQHSTATPDHQPQPSPSLSAAADGQTKAASESSTPPSTPSQPPQPHQQQQQAPQQVGAVPLPTQVLPAGVFAQMLPQQFPMGFAMPQAVAAAPGQAAPAFLQQANIQQLAAMQMLQQQQRVFQAPQAAPQLIQGPNGQMMYVVQQQQPVTQFVQVQTPQGMQLMQVAMAPSIAPQAPFGMPLNFAAAPGGFAMLNAPQQFGAVMPMNMAPLQPAGQVPAAVTAAAAAQGQRNRPLPAATQPNQKALRKAMKQSTKTQALESAVPPAAAPVSAPAKLPPSVASIQLNPKATPFVPSSALLPLPTETPQSQELSGDAEPPIEVPVVPLVESTAVPQDEPEDQSSSD